jgi:heptose I phosphotransferase
MIAPFWRRLTQGQWIEHARSDWVSVLGRDWTQEIMQVRVTDRFHAKQGRSTGRWLVPRSGLSVYLKRHYELSRWKGVLATFWPRGQWSPAFREWANLDWARRAGLPVPDAVAAAQRIGPAGKLQSVLAIEELRGMLPLNEALAIAAVQLPASVFRAWKHSAARELGRLVGLLHGIGRFHKDLYLCHFYVPMAKLEPVAAAKLTMIDLHRLAYHPLTRHFRQIKDLAQLLYSSKIPGIEVRDRLVFWRSYSARPARRQLNRWVRRLVTLKSGRYERHNARRILRAGKSAA